MTISAFDFFAQIMIVISGLMAIIMIAKKNKWGFVIGLCSQPFWIFTTVVHQQWIIFAQTIIYVFIWLFGVYEWFFKKPKEKNQEEHLQQLFLLLFLNLEKLTHDQIEELLDRKDALRQILADRLKYFPLLYKRRKNYLSLKKELASYSTDELKQIVDGFDETHPNQDPDYYTPEYVAWEILGEREKV
jgi:hypothetical protein